MKGIVFISVLAMVVLISGCVEDTQNLTCQDYCEKQPHIICVGHWDISGTYPDCSCKWVCDVPQTPTCEEYCEDQPHALCVGEWDIFGSYPDCNCTWICDVNEITAKPGDGLCDYHETTMKPGDELEVYVNEKKHTVKVTKISSQDMVTVVVDGFFTHTFAQLDRFINLNNVGLYLKDVTYSDVNSALLWIGENKVNSPNDCFGLE